MEISGKKMPDFELSVNVEISRTIISENIRNACYDNYTVFDKYKFRGFKSQIPYYTGMNGVLIF